MGGGGHRRSLWDFAWKWWASGPTLSWEEGPSPTICPSFSGTVD